MAAAVGAEDGVAPLPPASDPRALSGAPEIVLMVVALSVAAGVIHAVAMLTHFGEWWVYGVFLLADGQSPKDRALPSSSIGTPQITSP